MATLYKEGVEGKYKWLAPKQAKKWGYVASASTGRRLEEGTGRLPRVKRKRMRYS